MKIKVLAALTGGILLFAGCDKATPAGPAFQPSDNSISSYIDAYQADASIVYRHEPTGTAGDGQSTYDNMRIDFYAGGFDPWNHDPTRVQVITNRSLSQRYDSLVTAHGDRGYWYDPARSADEVLFKGVRAIDIVSDTPYDPAHPAGASLADVFSLTVNRAVQGEVDGHRGYVLEAKTYLSIAQMQVSELDLLNRVFILKPIKAPATTSTHVFTVTYTDGNGRTIVARTKAFKIKVQ